MRLFTSLLFFLGIHSSLLFAGTRDPNTPDSKYVEFGKQFPAVVRVKAFGKCDNPKCPEKEHEQAGSAVIIRPNWILTAAHVLKDTRDQRIIKDDGKTYRLQKIIVHKDYNKENIGWYDVALGYCAEDFNLDFYTPLYNGTDEIGKPITIAGYGIHGTFLSGGAVSDGKKRGGHNVIDSADRAVLICSPSVGSKRMPLEFMIAPGDSGGGMFIGNHLAGISSFVMSTDKNPDGTYGDESAFTRVSMHVNWIQEQIETYELALKARTTTGPDIRLVDLETQP